jgi:hypothetical protein
MVNFPLGHPDLDPRYRKGRLGPFHTCHPEVAVFATEGSVHFADSIGAAANCIGPSSGKERPPQDDNALEDDMWLEYDKRFAKSFVWNILRVRYLESRFCADQIGFRECKVFEIKILTEVI